MIKRSPVVLLVDDDPNDVLLLKRAMARAGVRQSVFVVNDGEEAIAYLEGTGPYGDRSACPFPCLVLLDIKMPRKNGLEVLRWLRTQEGLEDLPVCMITSSGETCDHQEAQKYGIEAYFVKPVSFEDFVRMAQEIHREAEEHCEGAGDSAA